MAAAKDGLDDLPDEVLVLGAILGDLRAFDTLALRYRAAVYRVAQSIVGTDLAEDALQEALLSAFKALPSLEEPERFAAWLYAITRHAALKTSRRVREVRKRSVDLDTAIIEHSAALARPMAPVDTFETAWVRAAIEMLEDDYQLILKLRFYDEMSLKRIADFLSLPLSTVKWRLHTAKQKLRLQLTSGAEKQLKEPVRRGK